MGTRVATGAITILDITDGVNPLSVTLGNQSHTFAANTFGVVSSAELATFSSDVFVYVGATRATYDNTANPEVNTYKITDMDATSGWGSVNTPAGGQAVITCSTTPGNTTNKTGTVVLSIDITNSVGSSTSVEVTITWSVMIEGAGGSAIWITPSRLTFQYDETGTTTTDNDIILGLTYAGNLGALSAEYARNGSNVWHTLVQGTTANKAKTLDLSSPHAGDQIVISSANFGESDIFSVRITGVNGARDTISIIKIKDGLTGKASLFVTIASNKNGFSFRNNFSGNGATSTAKTLTASVFDMADGAAVQESKIAYVWQKNGVNFGGTAKTQVVTASDVEDNGSDQFQCNVTVTD
jgi:hypothetical protein